MDKKVLVAISGGVDSSVAAALLKRRGFSVASVFMRFWPHNPSTEERAKAIADILDIPFYTFNFTDQFKKEVVDYFISEHRKGRTPNPCVNCNKRIKLGLLLDRAKSMGFDFVATGHYTRIENGEIYRAKDKEKDQSYFLWKLKTEQIKKVLFPLADYDKDEVREMADKFKLPFLGVEESSNLCFIDNSLESFLSDCLGKKPGDIIDEKGDVIGQHSGLWFHTIGQRKGLGLSGGPYFVIKKDYTKNLLIISKDPSYLESDYLEIDDINWISDKPKFPFRAGVQIRYRHKVSPARIVDNGIIKISFEKPQRAIAPGQSAVIYEGNRILGGGVIR